MTTELAINDTIEIVTANPNTPTPTIDPISKLRPSEKKSCWANQYGNGDWQIHLFINLARRKESQILIFFRDSVLVFTATHDV